MTALLAIPEELRARPQWVAYSLEERDGKPTKVPKNPRTSKHASSTDPATWGTFAEARAAVARYDLDGVGFVFSPDDRFVGIDLDHCRDPQTGEIEDWALQIVNAICSYTEVSPSGTGLHIIAKAKLPPDAWHKVYPFGDDRAVEMYDRGRFFCMTGEPLRVTP